MSTTEVSRPRIDLRSDTVTHPTAAMRQAMAAAPVGDDVYGEDPTVRKLEWRAAEMLGKEAAIFVPSGVMGNTIAVKLHTQHGDEFVCESHAHVVDWELAMPAWFSGAMPRTVPAPDGVLRWEHIEPVLRPASPHNSGTTLICLENTHNMAGGIVTPVAELERIYSEAKSRGLAVHLDGARVFHAATYLGVPVADITRNADTVMCCLSKGLGAPVGSLLVGNLRDIQRAHGLRKRLGGGMRQAGILAAAGLIALEEMSQRLQEDHDKSLRLANALSTVPGITVLHNVQTNIVIFDVAATGLSPDTISARLRAQNVHIGGVGGTRMRMVTHFDVSLEQCLEAVELLHHAILGDSSTRLQLGMSRLG